MPKIPLRVIPKPEEGTRAVIIKQGEGTILIRGEAAGHDYVCGNCGSVLLASMAKGQVRNMVFGCNKCGAFNDTEQD